MTHYEEPEDRLPLDELIESVLQVWLNPRHPEAWNGSFIIDTELHDGHDQAPRRPAHVVSFDDSGGYFYGKLTGRKRRMLRLDEHHDYQVIRARDLCEAFHADEITIATRISPDDRAVAYRTVQSIEVIEREHRIEKHRSENERIKALSTPEALRIKKEREASAAKRRGEIEARWKKRLFGIGGRK